MSTIPFKEKKQRVGEAREVLDAIGHDNEKEGIKWTQYFMDLWDEKQWYENQVKKEKLQKKRKLSKLSYFHAIGNMIQEELSELDIPHGYVAWVDVTKKGVKLTLKTYANKNFYRAFRPDGTPAIDFTAVVGILTDLQDQVDLCEEERWNTFQNTTGMILPS